MRLFIAEKPSLGREIAKGLGGGKNKDGYIEISSGEDIVTWEFGHLLENYAPDDYDDKYKVNRLEDLPIVPEKWKMKLRGDDVKKQFGVIKSLLEKADVIVHAGDPDREGQLLVDELLDYLHNTKPVQRVLLNALDEKSVRQALADLRDNREFEGLSNSAKARSYADWLVGMNLSRAFSIPARNAGYSKALRIGRVKTPTMALVVRREDEIKGFHPVTHYQLQIDWRYQESETIRSLWQPDDNIEGLDLEEHLIDRKQVDNLLSRLQKNPTPAAVSKIEKTEKHEAQRLTYSLSALQVEAGKRFGYDPKTVLQCMQQLYEKKLTTYPRSDCDYLPTNQMSDAKEILANLSATHEDFSVPIQNADLGINSRAWDDSKISAHHAIIPTLEKCDFSSLNEKEQNLYRMVAIAYIAQFYPEHIYQSVKIWIECADETFLATGKTILQNGWKELYRSSESQNAQDEELRTIPNISEGETVAYRDGKILTKQTKPPARFTPSTLLQAMKEIHKYVKDKSLKEKLKSVSGIGTEATRAAIIDALLESDFLRLEKKHIVPTEQAYMMMKFLPETITWPDTTALWEDELEAIMENRQTVEEFIESKLSTIDSCVNEAKWLKIEPPKDAVLCPDCQKVLIRRKGKNGYFWGCSNYPECKRTFPDKHGKPDTEDHTVECPACKIGRLRRLKGKYGYFWGCGNPDCRKNFRDKNGKPDMNLKS